MQNESIARITADLGTAGWSVSPDFLAPPQVAALARECRERWQEGDFHRAGIGRNRHLQVNEEVRGDHVRWLEERTASAAQRSYEAEIEGLRLALNESLFLGLFDFESHLAIYPPGTFYRRHLDQHQGSDRRVVSTILYLNEGWLPSDGGQLRIFLDDEGETWRDVLPLAGTLVCFLSGSFPHEVLATSRERMSLTGWLRRR